MTRFFDSRALVRGCMSCLLLTTAACKQLTELDDDRNEVVPEAVQVAFDETCVAAGCHDRASRAGGLSLERGDANAILGGSSTQSSLPLVAIGDVGGSYLAIKLLPDERIEPGTRALDRMPVGGLEDAENQANVAIILGWIAGAELGGGDDGDAPRACGIDDVTSVVASPVEYGNGADLLPPEIGMLLERNCGCHYASDPSEINEGVPKYNRDIQLATYADFHADYDDGTGARPTHEIVQDLTIDRPLMPPTYYCTEQDVGALTQEDFELLRAWLDAGAPDAPTWSAGDGTGETGDTGDTGETSGAGETETSA